MFFYVFLNVLNNDDGRMSTSKSISSGMDGDLTGRKESMFPTQVLDQTFNPMLKGGNEPLDPSTTLRQWPKKCMASKPN